MREVTLAALKSGRPMVVCTAHFGNFENLAAVHNLQGYPIAMVVRRMGAGWFGRFWNRGRSRAGLEVLEVTRGETLKAAQRAMREGRVLGYVIDQNMPGHRAIFPTFFGVPAATAPTPAYLAMRSGAVVFFALDVPLDDGRHQIVIEGPLEPPDTGDRDADVLAFMQDLNDRLERWVRLYPERWYWLHRRWKTRPPEGGARKHGVPGALTPPGARSRHGPWSGAPPHLAPLAALLQRFAQEPRGRGGRLRRRRVRLRRDRADQPRGPGAHRALRAERAEGRRGGQRRPEPGRARRRGARRRAGRRTMRSAPGSSAVLRAGRST